MSEPFQESTPPSTGDDSRSKRAAWRLYVVLAILLFISAYTYVLQSNYSESTLNAAVDRNIACSDAVHEVISSKLVYNDFALVNDVQDMDSPRYRTLQANLNELRRLNSTRYLYTAKRADDGTLVYLVDGLDYGAEDFAYPGTPIEDEMVPYIEKALAGETIYSQEIVDTT